MNETASATRKILGRLLIESASITDRALATALEQQRQTGQRLGSTLVRMGHCGEEQVARSLAQQLSLPYAPPPLQPKTEALPLVGEDLARLNAVIPLGLGPRTVRLAMADPLDLATVDDVRFRTGRRVEAVVASPTAVAEALELALGDDLRIFVDALPGEPIGDSGTDGASVEAAASAAPVVQLVERILKEAVSAGASDVHLERHPEFLAVGMGGAVVVPCAHCGLEAPVASLGCPHCGAARVVLCPCGRELSREWRFCPGCLRRVLR